MKPGRMWAVMTLVLALHPPVLSRPLPGSAAAAGGGGNAGLSDGRSEGWRKPIHPKVVRHKGHKGTKHTNEHRRVRH